MKVLKAKNIKMKQMKVRNKKVKHKKQRCTFKYVILLMTTMMISGNNMAEEIVSQGEVQRVEREINIEGSNKYSSIYLDEEVYRYVADDLRDIRIIDDEGNAVPYYICNETNYEEKKQSIYDAKIIDSYHKNNREYFDIEVKQEDHMDRLVSYLEINIESSNFASSVTMQGSYDGTVWETINSGKETQLYQVAAGRQMRFYFDKPVKYKFFRMSMPKQIEEIEPYDVKAVYENTQYHLHNYCKEKESSFNMDTNDEKKISMVAIENSDHLRVSRLILKIGGMFTRSYSLYGITSSGVMEQICTGSIYSTDINDESSDIAINMATDRIYVGYRLQIDNLDNKPLDIKRIEAIYSIDKLVFETEGKKHYMLSYGDKHLEAPAYDITYYRQKIEAQNQNICTLGKAKIVEDQKEASKQEKDFTLFFEILIGVTSLILIIVIIKSNKRIDRSAK